MEDLLIQIVKDASGNKQAAVRKSAQEAYDFLETQHGNLRAPPFEMRQICLNALEKALLSKNNKLTSHAVIGFQKLLRDDRFHSSFECENEIQWLPSQMLHAVDSIHLHSDDIQIEILKVLLNMACTNWWSMNAKMIQQIFQLCLDVYIDGSAAVRTAAQATAHQTLRSFCNYLEEESKAAQSNPFQSTNESSGISFSVFDDVIPVFNYLCKKIDEYQRVYHGKGTNPLVFLLEGILTLISSLPVAAKESSSLSNFLWQKLCPSLVAFLGSPRTDKNIVSSQRPINSENTEIGRGSGCLASAPAFSGTEARMVYSIATKLVDLVGTLPSLKPMFESLFHRMLHYPPPQHRLEALKAVKDILKDPELLLKLTGPSVKEDNANSPQLELALLTLIMDAVVECSHCSESNVCYASVSCIVAFLGTLEQLCLGKGFSNWQIETINDLYKDLASSDYKGPFTYKAREEFILKNGITEKNLKNSENKFISSLTIQPNIENIVNNHEIDSDVENEIEDDTGYQGDQEDVDFEEQCNYKNKFIMEKELDNTKNNVAGNEIQVTEEILEKEEIIPEKIEEDQSNTVNETRNLDKTEDTKTRIVPENVSEEHDSDSSGLTEGPEEDCFEEDEIDESLEDAVKQLAAEEAARREKLPKTLLGEESGKSEREQIERLCEARNEFAQLERNNACHFVSILQSLLPSYLSIRSSIEVDEAFQDFASKYCEGVYSHQNVASDQNSSSESLAHITIINADGVYLATYSALLLNLKLIRNGYYESDCSTCIPLSEEQFVEEVHGSGVLVYLSTLWLSELYQQILKRNLLQESGYNPKSSENSALINLLTGTDNGYSAWILSLSDLDGLNSDSPGDQLLSDYRRLEKAATNVEKSPLVKAGMKFSRRLLTGCWSSILEVLSLLLNGKNSCGITSSIGLMLGMEGSKEEHRKARDAVASSLEGLQKAARLCNILGLQSRCNSVFALLADASCPSYETKEMASTNKKKSSTLLYRPKSVRLHTSHILSMDVLLSRGLELGSHSPECWRHIFRCCVYIADLEHSYFSHLNQNNNSNSGNRSSLTKLQMKLNDSQSTNPSNNLDFCPVGEITFPSFVADALSQSINLQELIQSNNTESSSGIISNGSCMLQIICGLSQQIDRLFDDAASKLNLQALISFLTELCAASQVQLFSEMAKRKPAIVLTNSLGKQGGGLLLLYRLGDVMLKCVRSGRPLIHIMKTWSVVGPHFMEAACHKDRTISKKAISCIHDIVTSLLAAQNELPHFHFNEALFKPFENLLCLELCDIDVQDQIISSICEFVEGSTTEIRSGWRPLFGTLRAVHPSSLSVPNLETLSSSGHMHVVMDVFEAFLSTDNVLVFANAAVDCILCLLKHIRGSAENNEEKENSNEDCYEQNPISLDLCLAALKFIHRCSGILGSMYKMPSCPLFHAAHRIKLNSIPQFVDPVIPNLELVQIDQEINISPNYLSQITKEATEILMRIEPTCITLENLDKPSGILHVWFLLLEGLVSSVSMCERKHQPYTMEALFSQLRALIDVPGPEFGIYSVNHLLLPMLQAWLRRTSRIYRGWDNYAPNFKQCCGLATDLVVDYLAKLHDRDQLNVTPGVSLMLKQLLLVLIECVAQPTESISRLGCACIRHVIITASPYFTPTLWEIICLSIHRACTVSLHSLYQLMEAFHTESDNFYGDIGQVKVATRRDCTAHETIRLQQLAFQVFLLDNQRGHGLCLEPKEDENRSFVFLLYPPNVEHTLNPDLYIIRVPFRNLVVGLLSHLILLQTVGTLLLQGSPHIVPSLANVLLTSPAVTPSEIPSTHLGKKASNLPGLLPFLPTRALHILLDCLDISYRSSCEFDRRPGLKFLIQKVSQAEVAANLYKQAGASWTMHVVTLFHLVIHDERFQSLENMKKELLSNNSRECGRSEGNGSYMNELRCLLANLCERYVEMVLDTDGKYAQNDKMSDEPIFFLVAQPDDFPEISTTCPPAKNDKEGNGVDGAARAQNESVEERQSNAEIVKVETVYQAGDGEKEDQEQDEMTKEIPKLLENKIIAKDDNPEYDDDEDGEEEEKTRVYTVATRKDIDSVIQEYKKRKNQRSMPNRSGPDKKKGPSLNCGEKSSRPSEYVPEEIAIQKTKSLLKDSEAHSKVIGEMLLSVFDLLCQLSDDQFKTLLPLTFTMVRTLIAHAQDSTLRQTLAEYVQRVATLYNFALE